MDEPVRKKTILAWQPPAAAARRSDDDTLISHGVPPSHDATLERAVVPSPQAAPEHHLDSTVRPIEHAKEPAAARASEPHHEGAALVPGSVIGGRYVIKSLAGEGGFAAVYRAADSEIPNHEVAVKLLNAKAESVQAQAAALRELTLIAAVSHPSVVQFKDYGWHEGRLFFAMPWYRGRTLASALPLDRASARRIFERCAYGLQAMHEAGICHYDIKPDNIFLANIAGFEAGFPVLLDLGIAAKRGETPMALTPEYASPETASAILTGGGTPVGTAADVYSLALSLRNVLEPETAPAFGESIPVFLHKRTLEPVPPPSAKDLRYLKPLFERWLSLEPSERPSAAEFAVELAALTQPEEQRAERKRLLLRAAPVVAVLAILVTTLAFALKSKTKELVQQQAIAAKEGIETNARFEQLKEQSKNQLDEKLQLAQAFQSERDTVKKQLDSTRGTLSRADEDRERLRSDLTKRTKERDQTRDDLQAQTTALNQTRADLQKTSQDLDTRTRALAQSQSALAQSQGELAQRSQDLATRTAERDRTQADLARRQNELEAARAELERRTKERDRLSDDLTKREAELKSTQDALVRRNKELDAAEREQKKLETELSKATKQRDAAVQAQAPAQGKPARHKAAPATP